MQRNWSIHKLLMGVYNGAASLKTVWQFLKKLNIKLSYDPAILPLDIYWREMKTYIHKKPVWEWS